MNPHELRRILILANECKEGDLAVGGTFDDKERREARNVLSQIALDEIDRTALVDDAVTEALLGRAI